MLKQVFAGTNVEYKILDNKIVLTAKETKVTQQKTKPVAGTVKDKNGEPLIGVSIMEKGTTNGTVTDLDGNYTLTPQTAARYYYSRMWVIRKRNYLSLVRY